MDTPSYLDIVILSITVVFSVATIYLSVRELKKRHDTHIKHINLAAEYEQEFEAYVASELDKILTKFPDVRINRQSVIQSSSAYLSEKELLGESIVLRKLAGKIEELSISKTNLRLKRLFDVIASTLVCTFILTWLVPLIGILIRLESPGPVLFVQTRSGRYGQPFPCLKFRTVFYSPVTFKEGTYRERITRIGKFLRKTNLDEIPQFLNVLVGDMSIVGPRPHPAKYDDQYWNLLPNYYKRYAVPPGITGLAQVRGARGITDNSFQIYRRLRYDLFYIKKYNLGLDLLICWWTLKAVIKGDPNAW